MKSTFSKFVLASAVVAAAAAFTAIPAMAATESAANINVPFSFTVHGKSLPAGTYQVRWDGTGNFVTMQNSTAVQTFLWRPTESATTDRRVILRFEEHGQQHVLQSIRYGAMTTPQLTRKARKNEEISPLYRSEGQ
jgi:hypothetical protein